LKSFLKWFSKETNLEVFNEIAEAVPTAELRPLDPNEKEPVQADEEDMGMTYDELDTFGRLRKIEKCGPVSMFERLLIMW
jgi:NAD+ synthase (glutamine-hydrolysing)